MCVGASGGTDLNCYYFAKLSVQLSTHHDKTKMSVSRKPCISRKNYGNFDRILPIANDYFVSVNLMPAVN